MCVCMHVCVQGDVILIWRVTAVKTITRRVMQLRSVTQIHSQTLMWRKVFDILV